MSTISRTPTSSDAYRTSSRLTGMFSNLDTDTIVKSMTAGQQSRIDKVKGQQTRQEWVNDALTSVEDQINDFLNTYVSGTGTSSMLRSATYQTFKAVTSSTSNAVTVSGTSLAEDGSYTVQVNRLAQNASVSSSNISASGTTEISSSNTAALSDLKFANSLKFSGNKISFSINGKMFTFSKDTSLQNMINTVNNDETAGVTMKYSRLTNGFTITADSGGADSKVSIQNIAGNAFGTNSAFGIAEGTVSSTVTMFSSEGISMGVTTDAALGELAFKNALTYDSNGKISFSINGKAFEFTASTKLQTMLDDINNDTDANVTMSYNATTDGFSITSDSGGDVAITNLAGNAFGVSGADSAFGIAAGTVSGSVSSSDIGGLDTDLALQSLRFANGKRLTFDNGKLSFSINGQTFSYDKTTKLQDMLDDINNNAAAKVTLSYNSLTDGFMITSDSGSDGSLVIDNISGNAFGTSSAFGIAEGTVTKGADAEAVINGTTVTRDSNDFPIDGVNYSLKKVTQGTSEEKVVYSLEHDYSATVDAVAKFVDAYNTLFSTLKALDTETDYSDDYPPLTDDQRSEMSDDQITAWEKKAKSGLLRHNADLESLMSTMKNAFYSAIGGTGKNATQIGITTAGYFDSNAGQVILDESALEDALANNPEEVVRMFTNGSSTSASSEQGLAYRLRSAMTKYSSAVTESIKTGTKKLDDYDTQIDSLEDKLSSLAERYYAKFSNMETALSKLNSQSSYISQMFGSSSN
jgi:flagellar hook-associated protein 2